MKQKCDAPFQSQDILDNNEDLSDNFIRDDNAIVWEIPNTPFLQDEVQQSDEDNSNDDNNNILMITTATHSIISNNDLEHMFQKI